jgi:hypothetical protein
MTGDGWVTRFEVANIFFDFRRRRRNRGQMVSWIENIQEKARACQMVTWIEVIQEKARKRIYLFLCFLRSEREKPGSFLLALMSAFL